MNDRTAARRKKHFVTSRNKVIAVSAAILLILIGLHIVMSATAGIKDFKTDIAQSETLYKSVTVDCFVIRSEKYLSNGSNGYLVPLVSDGEKLCGGEEYAKVFATKEDSETYIRAQKISEELEYYESISKIASLATANAGAVARQVSDSLTELTDAIYTNNLNLLPARIKNLRTSISKKQAADGYDVDCSGKINTLKAELAALSVPAGKSLSLPEWTEKKKDIFGNTETVKRSDSGYFSGNCDGYEYLADYYDSCADMTPEQVSKILASEPKKIPAGSEYKLVKTASSYIVCNIPTVSLSGIRQGRKYQINFPSSNAGAVSAKVVSMVPADNGLTAVVFSTTDISSAIIALRSETAQIRVATSENSFRIPKSTLHKSTELINVAVYAETETETETESETVAATVPADGSETTTAAPLPERYDLTESEYYWIWTAAGTEKIPVQKKVNIVFFDGDYVIVNNPTDSPDYIRAGEKVIVSGTVGRAFEKIRKENEKAKKKAKEERNAEYNSELESRRAASTETTNP